MQKTRSRKGIHPQTTELREWLEKYAHLANKKGISTSTYERYKPRTWPFWRTVLKDEGLCQNASNWYKFQEELLR